MNIKSLSIATVLAVGSVCAELAVATTPLVTLESVQVRPFSAQLTQQEYERNSPIPTLAALQVRPSAEQITAYVAEIALSAVARELAVQLSVPNLNLSSSELQALVDRSVRIALQR